MTCVIGLAQDGIVWIGADSAGTNDYFQQTIRADLKVFKNPPFIMGFCGSFRMGQLLHWKLSVDEQTSTQSDEEYMCTTFIDSVRACLKEGGYSKVEHNVEEGGYFMVGYKGKLYSVESDFQVGISTRNYIAIGCGEDLAMGALDILVENPKLSHKEIIIRALKTAERFSAGVAGPFVVLKG